MAELMQIIKLISGIMVMPVGASSFSEGLRWGVDLFLALKES
jgi:enolase